MNFSVLQISGQKHPNQQANINDHFQAGPNHFGLDKEHLNASLSHNSSLSWFSPVLTHRWVFCSVVNFPSLFLFPPSVFFCFPFPCPDWNFSYLSLLSPFFTLPVIPVLISLCSSPWKIQLPSSPSWSETPMHMGSELLLSHLSLVRILNPCTVLLYYPASAPDLNFNQIFYSLIFHLPGVMSLALQVPGLNATCSSGPFHSTS